ncbi:MAG TPA: response regulator [Kouleothrix sp.]|uniref:response regulator n=1 Tax=Kouleothrix sp. TaxID=2779161 RepID=UPI002C98440A|nr:response regulator [Kouleothrix sp.]
MPHIIIAEDEDDVREFLTRAFSRAAPEAQIISAANGASALDLVQAHECHLLISDQRMPTMTGIDLLRAVRACGYVFPFIMLSADATVEAAALQAGVTAFFYKPLSLRQIREIVATWLAPPTYV